MMHHTVRMPNYKRLAGEDVNRCTACGKNRRSTVKWLLICGL